MARLGTPLYQGGTTLKHDETEGSVSTTAATKLYSAAFKYSATLRPMFVRVKNRHGSNKLYVEIPKGTGTLETATTGSWELDPGDSWVFQLPIKCPLASLGVSILGSAAATTYDIIWLP